MAFFKAIWRGNSKHKKLCEEWALTNNCKEANTSDYSTEGVTFHIKYLGSTLVETPSNEKATAEAIKTIITMAKASGKKLQRVSLNVNLHGIKMIDTATDDVHLEVSIYRISYCSADATHNHVFAFITTNPNETMECHAFLCPKRKMAQAVTLSVARSFNTVYELWQNSASTANEKDGGDIETDNFSGFCSKLNEVAQSKMCKESSKSLLIDLNCEEPVQTESGNTWVCFDNDDDRLDQLSNQKKTSLYSPQHQLNVFAGNKSSSSAWGDMTLLL